MTVKELNREQLDCLKQNYIFETVENPSYSELAESFYIFDEVIYEYYEGINFVEDDFY